MSLKRRAHFRICFHPKPWLRCVSQNLFSLERCAQSGPKHASRPSVVHHRCGATRADAKRPIRLVQGSIYTHAHVHPHLNTHKTFIWSKVAWLHARDAHFHILSLSDLLTFVSLYKAVRIAGIVWWQILRCASWTKICFSFRRGARTGPKHARRPSGMNHGKAMDVAMMGLTPCGPRRNFGRNH